ncbi:MAG: ATP-binding protein, partial [Coriobacteriia bacterium]|nr:ATP-binding protein [Coriobacteriia bacterium]
MSVEKIALTVPSRGEYAKTVRMTASSLVSRMGMTFDDIEDVRMAAEEVFVYACDHGPASGAVTLEFALDNDVFEMKVALADSLRLTDEDAERRAAYATFILQSVADTFEMSSDETGPY